MYNDSYAAEKAYDDLYESQVEPKDCGSCQGEGKIYFSDCCGAYVKDDTCIDCGKLCAEDNEPCSTCNGEGVI